jgi:rRNA maturation endonuclease Nob1
MRRSEEGDPMLICALCEKECRDDARKCPECGSAMLIPLLSDDDPNSLLNALGMPPKEDEPQR